MRSPVSPQCLLLWDVYCFPCLSYLVPDDLVPQMNKLLIIQFSGDGCLNIKVRAVQVVSGFKRSFSTHSCVWEHQKVRQALACAAAYLSHANYAKRCNTPSPNRIRPSEQPCCDRRQCWSLQISCLLNEHKNVRVLYLLNKYIYPYVYI